MSRQVFELMRFQILTAALTDIGEEQLPDALVFALENRIYPIFEGEALHEPFDDYFFVTREKIQNLADNLDAHWRSGSTPSFSSGDRDQVMVAGTIWDRAALVNALRYMRLSRCFDDAYWEALTEAADFTTDAESIRDPFDRQSIALI